MRHATLEEMHVVSRESAVPSHVQRDRSRVGASRQVAVVEQELSVRIRLDALESEYLFVPNG
jgi:hypothetical protein